MSLKQSFSEETELAVLVAKEAGLLLLEGFGTSFSISAKDGRHNLVTEFDTKSEKFIIDRIKNQYPTHNFLCEESGRDFCKESNELWIIDPLDGTVNFAHNIPIFSVSIAFVKNTNILSAVVYHPIMDELFMAERGKGCYLNRQPLKTTEVKDFSEAVFGTGFPYNTYENPMHCIDHFVKVARQGIPIRRLGSAAIDLAYLAAGRFDAFWEVFLEPWDYAAGKLLVEEAGGKITDLKGQPHRDLKAGSVMASNPHLHERLVEQFSW